MTQSKSDTLNSPTTPMRGGQFSLRMLGILSTVWCVLLALAASILGICVPLLAFAALVSAVMLGFGDGLTRSRKACCTLAVLGAAGIVISFFLPVVEIFVSSSTTGWEAFEMGLGAPKAMLVNEIDKSLPGYQLARLLWFVAMAGGAYGTIFAIGSVITACWPRENRWRSAGRFLTGMTVVCAAAVPFGFSDERGTFGILPVLQSGYYVWLASLAVIWLSHAPRRHISSWLMFAGIAALIGLATAWHQIYLEERGPASFAQVEKVAARTAVPMRGQIQPPSPRRGEKVPKADEGARELS